MKKNLFPLIAILSLAHSVAFADSTSKKAVDDVHLAEVQAFYNELPTNRQKELTQIFNEVSVSNDFLTHLTEKTSDPNAKVYLLVQGLEFFEQDLWEPFDILQQKNRDSYFLHWSKKDSLAENIEKFKHSVNRLLQLYPQNQIVVFGFSAGGVIAVSGWDAMMSELSASDFSRLSLRTVAAVSHGYGFTKTALMASPFVGKTTVAIGIGIEGKLHHPQIQRCEQWITTNGDLDIHARANKDGHSPQDFSTPICGTDHLHELSQFGHFSALAYVLRSTLAEDESK